MKDIKIYGERNTGTVYLEWLLKKNLRINLLDEFELGWKRRLAPQNGEITNEQRNEILFLCLIKNPYSWVLSMYRKPKMHEYLKKLKFHEFVRYPYGDYANPLEMWNIKNRSYIELKNSVKHHQLVRYEDLVAQPKEILTQLREQFGLSKTLSWFKTQNRYISGTEGVLKRRFHSDYYLHERWKHELKDSDVQFINSILDKELMEKAGYEIL